MVFKKTIVHLYTNQYPFSFGEFVRGTLFLIQYANKNEMIVKLNIANHSISEYLIIDNYDTRGNHTKVYYDGINLNMLMDDLHEFKTNTAPFIVITTNTGIHKNEIDKLSIIEFNKLISFTPYINDMVNARLTSDLINSRVPPQITDSYNVINMYLANTNLNRSEIQSLSTQIQNSIDLSKTSIVIASNEYIRNTLTEFLGGYHVPLSRSIDSIPVLASNIVDFLITSKSKKIYTFSEYNSKQKKVTYDLRESTSLSIIELPEIYYITEPFAGVYPEAEFTDGTLQTAAFAYPCGITEDTTGNVYIADTMNHNIRKINVNGTVTTLAGSRGQAAGEINGSGEIALFSGPTGVTVDINGNIYVIDAINGLIRKVTSSGLVTTLAGSTAGFQNGTGSSAKFNFMYNNN
jgi:hypothetical protein